MCEDLGFDPQRIVFLGTLFETTFTLKQGKNYTLGKGLCGALELLGSHFSLGNKIFQQCLAVIHNSACQ